MSKRIFFLAIGLLLAGCKEGWTDENKQQYLQACQDSPNTSGMSAAQKTGYCQCSLDAVMKHYAGIEEVLVNKDSIAVDAALTPCREQALR